MDRAPAQGGRRGPGRGRRVRTSTTDVPKAGRPVSTGPIPIKSASPSGIAPPAPPVTAFQFTTWRLQPIEDAVPLSRSEAGGLHNSAPAQAHPATARRTLDHHSTSSSTAINRSAPAATPVGAGGAESYQRLLDIIRQRDDRHHQNALDSAARTWCMTFPICNDYNNSLEKGRLPQACGVNNLAIGCVHTYPDELADLSLLEERLLGIYTPCGWITKLTIDVNKETSGHYRKLKRGHITVFPNDVQGLAARVLPHPLVEERDRIHRALRWLKLHNDLYRNIAISEANLQSWANPAPGTDMPQELVDRIVRYETRAEDDIQGGHYIPASKRDAADEPVQNASEVLTMLQNRETKIARIEATANNGLGAIRSIEEEPSDIDTYTIKHEISELTSTGLLAINVAADHRVAERLRLMRTALQASDPHYRGPKPRNYAPGVNDVHTGLDKEPYITSRRPKGRGGPRRLPTHNKTADGAARGPSRPCHTGGFYLRPWARILLRRHRGRFATHPTFPFFAFNMPMRSDNRRISHARMAKRSFPRIEHIVRSLTANDVTAAETEYREHRTTSNADSLCLAYGMPGIWFTINPNDLTNEVNMKLTAAMASDDEAAFRRLLDHLRRRLVGISHRIRDPVSSATFFHHKIELFFKHYVAVGQDSVFGRVTSYFGCVETNERGALHIHGLMWLHTNNDLPNLFLNLAKEPDNTYTNRIYEYIDSVFSKHYRRGENIYSNVSHLTKDLSTLDAAYDSEVSRHPCRFKAPWARRDKTEFTTDGVLYIRRNHERINRYCPALTLDTPLWKRVALVRTVLEKAGGADANTIDEEDNGGDATRVNNKA
ncbi:hypothetical protein CMUS01_16102, partial [Colletotrichum musicola]